MADGAHLLPAEECGFHQKIDISLDRLEIEEPFLDGNGHGQALFLDAAPTYRGTGIMIEIAVQELDVPVLDVAQLKAFNHYIPLKLRVPCQHPAFLRFGGGVGHYFHDPV